MNYPNPPNERNNGMSVFLSRNINAAQANRIIVGKGLRKRQTSQGVIIDALSQSRSKTVSHPFKLYRLDPSEVDPADAAKVCYTVRSGMVEVRDHWINNLNSAGPSNVVNNNQTYYFDPAGGEIGDDVEPTEQSIGIPGFAGDYFALDDISGVDNETPDAGVHKYGCYYAFWIEIDDSTVNTSPTVSIQCRRFGWESGSGYTAVAFPPNQTMADVALGVPSPIFVDDYEVAVEIIPIAILQLHAGNALGGDGKIRDSKGIGVIDGTTGLEPAINQILRDHVVNRFRTFDMRAVGEFNPRQYRVYYPGDYVIYGAGGDNTDPTYGMWLAFGRGQNGGAVTVPSDNSSAGFLYVGNINPPSLTNPP